MTKIASLEQDDLTAHFDDTLGISFINYNGILTAETIASVYKWVEILLSQIDPSATRGVIYNFQDVTRFHPTYLSAVQRQSQRRNRDPENVGHPVALVVETLYQEKMVRVSTQISPRQSLARTRIVNSIGEALTFIEGWHSARV